MRLPLIALLSVLLAPAAMAQTRPAPEPAPQAETPSMPQMPAETGGSRCGSGRPVLS